MPNCTFCGAPFAADSPYYDMHIKAHRRYLAEQAATDLRVPENLTSDDGDEIGPLPYDEVEEPIHIKTGAAA